MLRSVRKSAIPVEKMKSFPFSVPVIKELTTLELGEPVTLFVGENGSGKSTLLEAIAAKCDLPIVGSKNLKQDKTLKHAVALAEYLNLSWDIKTRDGFFLRAEDFFGFTKMLNSLRDELGSTIREFDAEMSDGYGKQLAIGSLKGQIAALTQRYGVDLDAVSHGEGFLRLFQSRIKPNGLYLLDEPETPLSPTRQMTLLKMMHDAVADGCQFVVATHSPILMAFPDAEILDFDTVPPRSIDYDEVGHVEITKGFLFDRERYLRHLLE